MVDVWTDKLSSAALNFDRGLYFEGVKPRSIVHRVQVLLEAMYFSSESRLYRLKIVRFAEYHYWWLKSPYSNSLNRPAYVLRQWFSNCGARHPGGEGREMLERGAQHTFLQIKIKLCSPKQSHPSHWTLAFKCLLFFAEKN
jgi:hypothetical protein